MWDRCDPRSPDGREPGDSPERSRGSRGGATDRVRSDDTGDVFTRNLDLPRGHRCDLVRDRDRVYEINGAESRMLATINAARMLGRDAEHGTVEAGKLADLVVLDADPLVDIRNVTRLHRVVKDGVIFDPVKLLAGG